jgi:hypothetical protein
MTEKGRACWSPCYPDAVVCRRGAPREASPVLVTAMHHQRRHVCPSPMDYPCGRARASTPVPRSRSPVKCARQTVSRVVPGSMARQTRPTESKLQRAAKMQGGTRGESTECRLLALLWCSSVYTLRATSKGPSSCPRSSRRVDPWCPPRRSNYRTRVRHQTGLVTPSLPPSLPVSRLVSSLGPEP